MRNSDTEKVEGFILDFEGKEGDIMQAIYDHLATYPGVMVKLKYGIPFFYRKSWICYINPSKGRGVEWNFLRANEMSGIASFLDFRGRKQVAGKWITEVEMVFCEQMQGVWTMALELDDRIPYSGVKRKK